MRHKPYRSQIHARPVLRRVWLLLVAIAATIVLLAQPAAAQTPAGPDPSRPRLAVLNAFVGTWDVKLHNKQPRDSVVSYNETYHWALGGHFLRGDSNDHSEGIDIHVIATHDPASDGYPFWIFMSSGAWFYLEPAQWDERARSFTWQNNAGASLSYRSRCVFPQPDRRSCHTLVKDWKGSVVLENEVSAVRRAR